MALTVGTDTYVDVVEADLYIQSHYLSTSPERVAWEALDADDKEVLLRNSALNIDSLPLAGRKVDDTQKMAFPRMQSIDPRHCRCWDILAVNREIPKEVIYAQIEQALFLNSSTEDASSATRARLQQQGVKSFSLGDLSETYGDAVVGTSGNTLRQCGEKSLAFLNAWLSGGYRVCSSC